MPVPDCQTCGEHPAECNGAYEDAAEEKFACGECCGHGNEDGHCQPLCAQCGDVLNGETEMFSTPRQPDRGPFCRQCAADWGQRAA